MLLNGVSYKCYTLPQYDSPFVEDETIRIFARTPPPRGTLMAGRSKDYRFYLYVQEGTLYYEAYQGNSLIVSVTSDQDFGVGTLEVHRNVSAVELSIIDGENGQNIRIPFAGANISLEEFSFVRFTEICVGGGSLNNPIYSGPLEEVYYNLYHLSRQGAFNETNVSRVDRVNFVDSTAHIVLPGNLGDVSLINLQFRTSQQNAVLLHSENGNNSFRISINNSEVYISVLVDDIALIDSCDLTITPYNWYSLTVEAIIGSDSNNRVNVTISSPTTSTQCDITTSLIGTFSSTPVVIGGGAGGVEGLMGCLQLMLNMEPVDWKFVLSDTIQMHGCEACEILTPCLNGGTCQPLDDQTYNCSCADPYYGDFCGKLSHTIPPYTHVIIVWYNILVYVTCVMLM